MRVLGIDPGTAIVGYSIIDYKNNKIQLIDYGCIYTNKEDSLSLRLEQVYLRVESLINLYKPDHMAIEELFFFKNQKTIISVAQSRGVIILKAQLSGLDIYNYTPLQVKTGITGYGRANKKQVQEMTKIILKLSEIPKPDDAADALAICITHINSLGSKLSFGGANNLKKIVVPSGTNKISLEEYKNLLKK